MPHPVE